jgi:thiamine-phosphate pyrophosphorylase
MIAKLQYITQEIEGKSHAQLAEEACKAGITWVQLRVKNKGCAEWKEIALETQAVCKKYGAKLIINDSMTLAKDIGADGVHLGKNDLSTAEARRLLGDKFIIGGTANTFEDVLMHAQAGVNYIGLGPFRFTATKDKLSPILGLEGYKEILARCSTAGIQIPVIAIGGIVAGDVALILEAGLHGVAVSSAITNSGSKTDAVFQFNIALNSPSRKLEREKNEGI